MFDKRETAAIVAGLRLLQLMFISDDKLNTRRVRGGFYATLRDLHDWIWEDEDLFENLTAKEIDELCERINCMPAALIPDHASSPDTDFVLVGHSCWISVGFVQFHIVACASGVEVTVAHRNDASAVIDERWYEF